MIQTMQKTIPEIQLELMYSLEYVSNGSKWLIIP